MVEVSHSWFNRFRKILVRYEKLNITYLSLLHLAAAIITYRKAGFIYGLVLSCLDYHRLFEAEVVIHTLITRGKSKDYRLKGGEIFVDLA